MQSDAEKLREWLTKMSDKPRWSDSDELVIYAVVCKLLDACEQIQAIAGHPDAPKGCWMIIKRSRQAIADCAKEIE